MNILVISTIYPEPSDYDVISDTKAVHYFARNWAKNGHKILVCHPYRNPAYYAAKHFWHQDRKTIRETTIEGVDIIFGEVQLLVPHFYKPFAWQLRHLANRMKAYIEKNYRDFRVDITVVHFPVVTMEFNISFLNKQRNVCVLHNSDINLLLNMKEVKRKKYIKKLKDEFDCIAYRSQQIKKRCLEWGLYKIDSPIIYSGVDDSLLISHNVARKKAAEGLTKGLNIIFAGKLVAQKRIDSVIKTIGKILSMTNNNILFRIVGDGTKMEYLKHLARKTGVEKQVLFLGRLSRDMVIQEMRKSNMFIMVSKNETFGLVYLEAMAQGCITIGSRGEGIDGVIIDKKNGLLVDADNDEELGGLLLKLLSAPQKQIEDIMMAGYETAVSMTDSILAEVYLNVLKNDEGDI